MTCTPHLTHFVCLTQRANQGFFLRILWCSQNGDHPESNLAKSGYNLDMKVEKKERKESFYILG
jgi:hypothetical protein